MEANQVNCAEMCKEGCVLEDECPNLEYKQQASEFISDTSLDQMLEMAAAAARRKQLEQMAAPPQWVFPED